jgi:hypothetical protein
MLWALLCPLAAPFAPVVSPLRPRPLNHRFIRSAAIRRGAEMAADGRSVSSPKTPRRYGRRALRDHVVGAVYCGRSGGDDVAAVPAGVDQRAEFASGVAQRRIGRLPEVQVRSARGCGHGPRVGQGLAVCGGEPVEGQLAQFFAPRTCICPHSGRCALRAASDQAMVLSPVEHC